MTPFINGFYFPGGGVREGGHKLYMAVKCLYTTIDSGGQRSCCLLS